MEVYKILEKEDVLKKQFLITIKEIFMKVLWFEISVPSRYSDDGRVVAGWQDALENVVRQCHEIELYIAFETKDSEAKEKVVDGVTYIPMFSNFSFAEKKISNWTWSINERKVILHGKKVIERYQPDIIHVFGSEWPFGLLAQYTKIPLVIHIQGSIIPYNNALYPPRYNGFTFALAAGLNLRKGLHRLQGYYKDKYRLEMEKRIWKSVKHYMGRTSWDKALVNTLTKGCTYHHVEEALRSVFLNNEKLWSYHDNCKLRLLSTGCSSFWKGIDVMLKTACVLKETGVDFEWKVAGGMPAELKEIVEKKEGMKYADNNINFIGFCTPEQLIDLMCSSTMYVHTAYIENSPNSICEAQIVGMPIISTMVGGISTLVRNGEEGILLPANDPWQIAYALIELSEDKERLMKYSKASRKHALDRHSPDNIRRQLLECYYDIVK